MAGSKPRTLPFGTDDQFLLAAGQLRPAPACSTIRGCPSARQASLPSAVSRATIAPLSTLALTISSLPARIGEVAEPQPCVFVPTSACQTFLAGEAVGEHARAAEEDVDRLAVAHRACAKRSRAAA